MKDENLGDLFARIRTFEWDTKKRERNLRDHRIDFEDARAVFGNYAFIRRSDRGNEIRYQIFGYVDGREVAVACTIRENRCRIISARRARKDEREKYYRGLAGRSPTGED
jgi:uncharacterized DUF497 family protein